MHETVMGKHFCVGCSVEFTGHHQRFCSDTCRDEFYKQKHEEAIRGEDREAEAKNQIGEGQYSVLTHGVCREINKSNTRAASKREEADRKMEEADDQ